MKNRINKYLRNFGAEIHGIGYIQKLRNSDAKKDEWQRQREILGDKVKVIFDVGANRGKTTTKYLELFPKASVHAFEPFPKSSEIFKQAHQESSRVIFNEIALSNKIGRAEMSVNKSVDTNSLLQSKNIGATSDKYCKQVDSISVETKTIDNYCNSHNVSEIDILKMDVQGFELEVLKGASEMLKSGRIKLIYSETYFAQQYVDQPLFHDISKYLYEHGYVLQDLYDPYFSEKKILWCDSIFIHKTLAG
jgi:FkbM family methyltransferase